MSAISVQKRKKTQLGSLIAQLTLMYPLKLCQDVLWAHCTKQIQHILKRNQQTNSRRMEKGAIKYSEHLKKYYTKPLNPSKPILEHLAFASGRGCAENPNKSPFQSNFRSRKLFSFCSCLLFSPFLLLRLVRWRRIDLFCLFPGAFCPRSPFRPEFGI